MFNLSDRLFLIAGNLESFQRTGGQLTADEAHWLYRNLCQCAERARDLNDTIREAEGFIDDLTQGLTQRAPGRPRPAGAWLPTVIAGGRA